jgi:hypothetical protein
MKNLFLRTAAVTTVLSLAGFLPGTVLAQSNMRNEGALTLNMTSDDNHGFYAATIDSADGYAYFGAKYVYKVNLAGPLPVQIGAGVLIGKSYSGVMDSSAGCAYFSSGTSIYQILANGTNAPSEGLVMSVPFGSSAFVAQLLIDTSDPANHYLYAMTVTGGTASTLYKIALNNYPNSSAIIGSASIAGAQPALGYGAIDLTNRCAYYGNYIPSTAQVGMVKFALGNGTAGPTNLGTVWLDTTNRSVGGIALDLVNGYGYCASDGSDNLFGHGRVYKWALNGTGTPTFVAAVDMPTNEGYCHVATIRPANGLLYFSDDLSYPAKFYRYRLPAGTNAPVETVPLMLGGSTNTVLPAWGTNPTNASYWGEVFTRSLVYDPVRDFVYIGRDCADEQTQPYTNQIVKVALDRNETMLALTEESATTNNALPYQESFAGYTNGFSLVGTNGWSGEDEGMALVVSNTDSYGGIPPIAGTHPWMLQVDGAVTNRFNRSTTPNVWLDCVVQAQYWTDPLPPIPAANTPFALCMTTNGHVAVWNNTNPPVGGNGWTELTDTSISSNQFIRLTVQANYQRDTNGWFYYRLWVNGTPAANPRIWYATAVTNQNWFGDLLAQGRFALDDLVVTPSGPTLTGVSTGSASVNVRCLGLPGLSHRIWAATNLAMTAWQAIATNTAGTNGAWTFTDTNALTQQPIRFYRTSLP